MPRTTVEELHNLINICEDAREFYARASHRTTSQSMKATFRKIAATRESMIINLKSHILSLAGEVPEDDSFTDPPSNLFRRLKSKMENADLALVEKLEDAEDKTLAEFRKVLESGPPDATANLIERQMQILNETHSHMKFLKQHLGKAA